MKNYLCRSVFFCIKVLVYSLMLTLFINPWITGKYLRFDSAKPAFAFSDSDVDGVDDTIDNCPGVPNPSQSDLDGDGQGDACDPCPSMPFIESAPNIEWERTFDFNDLHSFDSGRSVRQTYDMPGGIADGYIALGRTGLDALSGDDMYLVRTDLNGDPTIGWGTNGDSSSTFGGSGMEAGMSVIQTIDMYSGMYDGYILAGYSDSFSGSMYDMYIVKTDLNGLPVPGWGTNGDGTSTFGGVGTERAYSIQQTFNFNMPGAMPDGYIILGSSDTLGMNQMYLVRTDMNGIAVPGWGTNGDGTSNFITDKGFSVQQTFDISGMADGYILAGRSAGGIELTKVDTMGFVQWNQNYGMADSGISIPSVLQTSDGGYVILGNALGGGMYLVRTDSNGIPVLGWGNNFDGTSIFTGALASSLKIDHDGGYILFGHTDPSFDMYLVKTDDQGIKKWDMAIPGNYQESGYSVDVTQDGGYIALGLTDTNAYDMYLVKLSVPQCSAVSDSDGDGIPDPSDNCPDIVNPDQTDLDGDGIGDVCDQCPASSDIDSDNDGFCGYSDNCIGLANGQIDSDNDGIGDECDPCPFISNAGIAPEVKWSREFVFNYVSGYDSGRSVKQTYDNNMPGALANGYIVLGRTSSGPGGTDMFLVRTDLNGDPLPGWGNNYNGTSIFGNSGVDTGLSVQQTFDPTGMQDGYILLGKTDSGTGGSYDMYLIKTDLSGNLQWEQSYGGPGTEIGYSVEQTNDGGYILAGYTDSVGAGGFDMYLVKTDASGNPVSGWGNNGDGTSTFGSSAGNEKGYSVHQTEDGGYIAAGLSELGPLGVFLVKTDSNGNSKWEQSYGSSIDTFASQPSVQQAEDGGYIVLANSGGNMLLIKTDGSGNQAPTWGNNGNGTSTIGGSGEEYGHSLIKAYDGGYVLFGHTSTDGVIFDMYMVKTNSSGTVEWEKTITGNANESGYSVDKTHDGGYIVTGLTDTNNTGSFDMYLVYLNAPGCVDDDGDGVLDGVDNCPGVANPDQYDGDGDGIGDACDPCPGSPSPDSDYDGICDVQDNCVGFYNPYQLDTDNDGIGDECDPCELLPVSYEPVIEWERTVEYNNAGGFDSGRSIIETYDSVGDVTANGYVSLGRTDAGSLGSTDMFLVRTDLNGDPLPGWGNNGDSTSAFDRGSLDSGYSIKQTFTGDVPGSLTDGYILLGKTGNSYNDYDMYLVRTDTNGVAVPGWGNNGDGSSTIGSQGGISSDIGLSVQQTFDGLGTPNGFVLFGTSDDSTGNSNMYIVKTDVSGYKQWEHTYGATSITKGYSIQRTADRGFILAGTSDSGISGQSLYMVKTDNAGNAQWEQYYGSGSIDIFSSTPKVQQTSDGGYILIGNLYNGIYIVKTDTVGNQIISWGNNGDGTSTFSSSGLIYGHSIQQTHDGGYILLGHSDPDIDGIFDVTFLKTNGFGIEKWTKVVPGNFNESAYSVDVTRDGGYIATGTSDVLEPLYEENFDMYIVKLKPPACSDIDDDGIPDPSDNCPGVANPDQSDLDGDGFGDACDQCPLDETNDGDGDGTCEDVDNCPGLANPDQSDLDGDGFGDACDQCPLDATNDGDGDGTCEDGDNCPGLTNPDQSDLDGDGFGDACDQCPLDPDNDADGDGVCGDLDGCPNDPNKTDPGACGCGNPDIDDDGDGYAVCEGDCNDNDPTVNPGAAEICDDGIDNDCDGINGVSTSFSYMTVDFSLVEVGATVTASADFVPDNSGEELSAEWNWGDGSTTTDVLPPDSTTATNSHVYNTVGVYTITLTLTGGCGSESIEYQYVVVYDPDGGFVTGGGHITSPPGAYTADPALTGRANFGFVSKYKKGATVPTGETEFQFKVGNLNFHSVDYEWLVVAGARAQFKGTGTINGTGTYKFLLTAIDADENVNDNLQLDRFRIKIWVDGGETVYDNGAGADDQDDNATTEIDGGSIVIHTNGN